MKTAKEWAAEVVDLCDHPDVEEYRVDIGDERAVVNVICSCSEQAIVRHDIATSIIERLVERVQADALPSDLMRQIEKIADDMDREGEEGITRPDRMYERAVPLLRKLVQR